VGRLPPVPPPPNPAPEPRDNVQKLPPPRIKGGLFFFFPPSKTREKTNLGASGSPPLPPAEPAGPAAPAPARKLPRPSIRPSVHPSSIHPSIHPPSILPRSLAPRCCPLGATGAGGGASRLGRKQTKCDSFTRFICCKH